MRGYYYSLVVICFKCGWVIEILSGEQVLMITVSERVSIMDLVLRKILLRHSH
jgi:hypothetical protein